MADHYLILPLGALSDVIASVKVCAARWERFKGFLCIYQCKYYNAISLVDIRSLISHAQNRRVVFTLIQLNDHIFDFING